MSIKPKLHQLLIISAAFALASCAQPRASISETNPVSPTSESVTSQEADVSGETTSESVSSSSASSSSSSLISYDNSGFSITTDDGEWSNEGNIYTISAYGSYSLSGELYGQIYVNVPTTEEGESDVELELSGTSITYGENSPIYIASADNVKIKAKKKTQNYVTDTRSLKTEDDDTQGGGAIYAKSDLKFNGTGSLEVVGSYNNGIHTSKDLKIQKQTLKVTAPNNAIKGSNSIKITSGTITAISTGGDGLKTSDTDLSSSGKQKGTITITGGTTTIYSACDGIDAAYDAIIEEGVDDDDTSIATHPTIDIYTNKYSEYTEDIIASSTETMYLRTTSYSSSYRYAVYFYNDDVDSGVWSDAIYSGSIKGGHSTYYYYELERPTSYSSFKIYAFNKSSTTNSTTSFVACSSGGTINVDHDTCTFTQSGSTISTGSWTDYSAQQQGGGMGPGGMDEGNTDKADVSAKGIKADNEIKISDGTINITAYDDGVHANYGDTFESGATGVGNVYISGGNTTISASDDGVHADAHLYISGGQITVTKSYEGLEGNQIHISGGTSYAYATDDAVNAGDGDNTAGLTPVIEVTDGYLFAAVPANGDTDGIDSNGDYKQSGGVVIACGPNSNGGGGASSLDVGDWNAAYVTGGTLVTFGRGAASFSNGSSITTSSKTGTYSSGTYLLTYGNGETITTMKLPASYSGVYSYSVNGSLSSCTKQ